MIINGNELFKFVNGILEPEGFLRKKDIWYCFTPECICYFGLRKSEFGGFYDAGIGCFLKEIYTEKDEYPKPGKRHLFYPLEDFVGRDLLRNTFDLENQEFSNDERELLIADLLNKYVIPFLSEISTKDGIKRAMYKYKDLKHYARGELLLVLNMNIDF
jgi:hypothetical protein